MTTDKSELYAQRLNRYVTANRNLKPDRVPLRPFAAEFTATHCGMTCQEVSHDYNKAFEAVIRCCHDYDWDAVVPNMVYVWTGLAQTAGLRYYAIPGIDIPADVAFQYKEPPNDSAWMKREDYDRLIEDPVRFLYEVWYPRVAAELAPEGAPHTFRHNLALVKSTWSMASYFNAFGPQIGRMKDECGTPSSICGMLKAPLDVLADKFRGYVGLAFDLMEIPEKVEAACHALMPHLQWIAHSGLDPTHNIPIPIWMHRGCVPFISHDHFNRIYWPTLKPIVESIWERGNQVLFYAEGKWDAHLDTFAELPEGSIIYHIDRGDPVLTQQKLGGKFCTTGGVTNALLFLGTPDQVRDRCKFLIDTLGQDGGYIMDASAIMQNDATVANVRAMTEFTRDYGVYSGQPSSAAPPLPPSNRPKGPAPVLPRVPAGVCFPWEERLKDIPSIPGDPMLARRIYEDLDALAYVYIWHMVLSF
ncbi:MAG: hypothetical protein C0504_08505 [Candidatus Solibacter sp.]|nr:hypothetical protein [Candidatus Solibacter sp.]